MRFVKPYGSHAVAIPVTKMSDWLSGLLGCGCNNDTRDDEQGVVPFQLTRIETTSRLKPKTAIEGRSSPVG